MKEFLRTLVFYGKCISRSIANNTVKAPLKGGLQFCTTTTDCSILKTCVRNF